MAWDNKYHNHLLLWVYNKSYIKPHHRLCKQAGWDFPWYFYFSSSSSFPSWQLRPAQGNVWRNVKDKTQSARWRIRRSQSGKTVPTLSVQKVCINPNYTGVFSKQLIPGGRGIIANPLESRIHHFNGFCKFCFKGAQIYMVHFKARQHF